MKKELLQNSESRDLAMARQVLGRVKEMDLTPEEKEEVMRLIDQAKKEESGGNMAKALVIYNELLRKLKYIKNPVSDVLKFNTPDGREFKIELQNELEYWADFYNEQGIDWINLPERIKLSEEKKAKLETGAKSLCPEGDFDKLKLLIIPEGLANNQENYQKLNDKIENNFKAKLNPDNWFSGLENKSDKFRLILVKDVEELRNDKVYQQYTVNLSLANLEAEGGLFERKDLQSIDAATYIIWQKEFFQRTGHLLDTKGQVWLTKNMLPEGHFKETQGLFAYVVDGEIIFKRAAQDYYAPQLGCRLACTVEI